jgi:hypothetical protein
VTPTHEPCTPRAQATRTSRVWMGDDGILRIAPFPGVTQTYADMVENLAAMADVAGGLRPPALGDMRGVRAIDRDARALVTTTPQVVSAMALLVGSPLSRAVGTFFMGFNKAPIPTRLFTSEADAIRWLRSLAT